MNETGVGGDPLIRPATGNDAITSGIEAGRRGLYREAIRYFDEALAVSVGLGDETLRDRILCNRSAAEVELGRIEEPRQELRRILLRSSDRENGFLAAYTIATSYELQKDFNRATFYARIAQDRARSLERPEWLAWSHNLTGNLLLSTNDMEGAREEFELAMRFIPAAPTVERAIILDNLGYCRLTEGRYGEGFSMLHESLRTLFRCRAPRYEPLPRISLCYGYIEVGKFRHALRHGQTALRISEANEDGVSIKNAHYLLGETYKQLGESGLALSYFTRLQQRYYPDAEHVPELLLAVDVLQMINLKG